MFITKTKKISPFLNEAEYFTLHYLNKLNFHLKNSLVVEVQGFFFNYFGLALESFSVFSSQIGNTYLFLFG